jgi:hypothetical protein
MLILCKTAHMLEAVRPIPLSVLDQWHTRLFGGPAPGGAQVPRLYACAACFKRPSRAGGVPRGAAGGAPAMKTWPTPYYTNKPLRESQQGETGTSTGAVKGWQTRKSGGGMPSEKPVAYKPGEGGVLPNVKWPVNAVSHDLATGRGWQHAGQQMSANVYTHPKIKGGLHLSARIDKPWAHVVDGKIQAQGKGHDTLDDYLGRGGGA